MTTRLFIATLFTTVTLAGCAPPTPEQQFITDATAALGGRERIAAVKTLALEGTGVNYNLGQDMKPEAATQTFAITDYKRVIDVANGRQRVQQTRTPKFAYFQGPQPQTQIQALDGTVAFNVNASGQATRLGAAAERDRRAEYFHHPVTLLRAAQSPDARVSNVRTAGAQRQADITTAEQAFTMTIDAAGVPVSISSPSYHPNLGDVVLTTTFDEYEALAGLNLPTVLVGKVDDFITWEIDATTESLDAAKDDLTAPAAVRAARSDKPEGLSPPVTVTVEVVAKGVWLLAGQSHHSALVEFNDHLMLIDAPQSEARTLAVIAKARELVPGKPLTQLVTTHHHFDHTAGLRAAVAEGLTVITHTGNRDWVERMATRPHTRQPDALQKAPKPLAVETVDAEREFRDAAMTLRLYHLAGNPHSETMLMAYLPASHVLIQVDAFSPGAQVNPYAANLLQNVQSRKLAIDRIVPLHGAIAPMADLLKAGQ